MGMRQLGHHRYSSVGGANLTESNELCVRRGLWTLLLSLSKWKFNYNFVTPFAFNFSLINL